MSRTHHHTDLSLRFVVETSDALARYLHDLEALQALDALNLELASAKSLVDDETGEHESYSPEEIAWFRRPVNARRGVS